MDSIQQDVISIADKESKMTLTQKKVLKASIELFAEKGFNGTSTALIADKAEVSQGTIFKYYKTKKDLLNAILDIIIQQLLPMYSENAINNVLKKANNFEEFIHAIIEDRYYFMQTNSQLLTIILSELLTNNNLVDKIKQEFNSKLIIIAQIIEDLGGKKLQISGLDVIRLIISQLITLFLEENRLQTNNIHEKISLIEQNILHASYF